MAGAEPVRLPGPVRHNASRLDGPVPQIANIRVMEKHPAFPTLAQAVFILFILYGVFMLVASAFVDAMGRFKDGDPVASGVIITVSVGMVIAALMTYKHLSYAALMHPGPSSVWSVLLLLALPVTLLFAGLAILMQDVLALVIYLLPLTRSQYESFQLLGSQGAASLIALCLVAPFLEEMLFRGIFLRSFLNQYSVGQAIVFSSLLFGAYHMNIYQCFAATTVGLIVAWLYLRTGSLWPCILAHAVYNFTWFALPTGGPNALTVGGIGMPALELQLAAVVMVVLGGAGMVKLLGLGMTSASGQTRQAD